MINRTAKMLFLNGFFVILPLLIACGKTDRLQDGVITINVPANINLLQTLRQQIGTFEQRNGVQVKLIPFSGQEKLYAMLAAGEPLDVFYTNAVVRDQLAAEGRLLNLDDITGQDSFVQNIRPQFKAAGTAIDGGWYQFCDWTFTYGIYYNKALFNELHIPCPDSSWTWDDMVQKARALTCDLDHDGKIDRYGIFIAKHFLSALETMNGAVYPEHALFYELPTESRQAYQKYLDLIYADRIMPELAYVQAQGMQLSQMLNSGKVAMVVEAVPNLDFIVALNIPWELAPLPRMGNHPVRYFRSSSGGLSVSASCKQPEKAWALIKWLVTSSPYNTPNPVLKDADFVTGWEKKHPILAGTHFGQVWRLSEQHDGGDSRDFVRYFSWSCNTILEYLAPKMDLLLAGKISLDDLAQSADPINRLVEAELDQVVQNPNIKPAFKEHIVATLQSRKALRKK
jgi:ABC-type glycerol-3-phosphate transport system substrate-binding protein